MFIRKLFHLSFLHETVDSTGGGADVPSGVQPTGQGDGGNSDFWGLFPGIPEDQRPTIEPHLKGIQGEVTKLQTAQAAFKPLTDAGYQPQQLQGLVSFDQRFQAQPVETWLDMAKMLQQNGVLHESLDLDAVKAIAAGQDVTEPVDSGEADPQSALIQQLQTELAELKNGFQQDRTRQSELVQDRLLQTQQASMKAELVKAGFTDEDLTPERLNSFIITHRGNIQSATQDLIKMRQGVLKGFTQQKTAPGELETRNGGPTVPKVSTRNASRDPFARARPAATNRLMRANRDGVQG